MNEAIITAIVAGIAMLAREVVPLVIRWFKSTHAAKQIDSSFVYEQVRQVIKDLRVDLAEAKETATKLQDKYTIVSNENATLRARLEMEQES